MARSNGPFGPGGTRPPVRRHPTDDPYAAGSPAGHGGGHNGQWPPAQYPDQAGQHGQGYHFPPEPEPNYGYAQQPPGFAQPSHAPYDNYSNGMEQPQYPQQQWGQPPDPRGYDLGNYMPSPQQPYPPADPAQFRAGPDRGYGGPRQAYADPDADYEDEEFADADEPRGGRRWMFIAAAALVGAVGVGGALAYTYKSLFAPSAGRVPVVKADNSNNKAKPSEKLLARPNDDASKQPEPADDRVGEESGGPKRVKTIPINPGAQAMAPAAPQGPQVAAPAVPGITLDIGPPPRAQASAPKGVQPPGAQPPRRVTLGEPPANLGPQQVQPEAEAAPPPAKRSVAAVAKPPQQKQAAATPAGHSAGLGFVAVLSSQKSRMDALKIFADLQQKYPDALSNKVPDVQEKDLSERGLGTMFRLVVGPPGSRTAASGLCGQLKAAGHEGCWVTEY